MGPTTYKLRYHLPKGGGGQSYGTNAFTEEVVEFHSFPAPENGVYPFPLKKGGMLYVGVAYFISAEPLRS